MVTRQCNTFVKEQKRKEKCTSSYRVQDKAKCFCQQSYNGQDNAKNIFGRRDKLTVDCGPASGQWFPNAHQGDEDRKIALTGRVTSFGVSSDEAVKLYLNLLQLCVKVEELSM